MKQKRKPATKKTKSKNYSLIITLAVIALLGSGLLITLGYYYGYSDGKVDAHSSFEDEKELSRKSIERLKYIIDTKNISTRELNERLKEVLREETRKQNSTASHEYSTKNHLPPKPIERATVKSANRAKLAIIIDDVSFDRDVKAIKALNLPLTMSFLPPSTIHPLSAKLANKEKIYMVHLPLEANNFSAAEASTLKASDSQKVISDKIRQIKKDFPHVKYINNHTGSKFTSSEIAMNRLVYALKQNNIRFIDSRTTAKTKAPIVMKSYGYPYIARDVFLDHVGEISEIKKELKRAVALAKRHGTAIAIGHPHKATLQALRESKQLLKEVELVKINELL